jgi:hypothetical protein
MTIVADRKKNGAAGTSKLPKKAKLAKLFENRKKNGAAGTRKASAESEKRSSAGAEKESEEVIFIIRLIDPKCPNCGGPWPCTCAARPPAEANDSIWDYAKGHERW